MKSMLKVVAVTAAFALVSAPAAFAAEQGPWSGPYVGGLLQSNTTSADGFSSASALGFGVFGGYQMQFSQHFVFGGDLFYNRNQTADHNVAGFGTISAGFDSYGIDFRAGFPVGEMAAWMPYVKLGYGSIKAHGGNVVSSGTESAVRYGAGVAWMLHKNLSLQAQYMYENLGSSNGNFKNEDISIGVAYHF